MKRFTGYRRNLSTLVDAGSVSHTALQRNADDAPQYEGVIWTDGSCTLRWLTAAKSTSVFTTFQDMVNIHGHPEYGTDIVFHDGAVPAEWKNRLLEYADTLQQAYHAEGKIHATVRVEDDKRGRLVAIDIAIPGGEVLRRVYPVNG